MKQPVAALIRSVLSEGLALSAGIQAAPSEVRLPARGADAAWPGAIRLGLDAGALSEKLTAARACFPPLFGVASVAAVSEKNGWLLFTLDPAVYDAALAAYPHPLPPERPEDDELRLRLFMFARHDPAPIPDDPALRRALLMLWAAEEKPSIARFEQAANALIDAALTPAPAARPAYARKLGAPARLALHIDPRFRPLSD